MQIRPRLRLLTLLKGTAFIAEIVACDDSEGPANPNRNLLGYKGVVVSAIEPIRLNVEPRQTSFKGNCSSFELASVDGARPTS